MKFYTVPVEMPKGYKLKVDELIDVLENYQIPHDSPGLKYKELLRHVDFTVETPPEHYDMMYIHTGDTETVHYKIPENVLEIVKIRARQLKLLPDNYVTAVIIDYFRHRAFQHLRLGIEIGLYEEGHILEAADYILEGGEL